LGAFFEDELKNIFRGLILIFLSLPAVAKTVPMDAKDQLLKTASEYNQVKEKAQDNKEKERLLLASIYKMTQRQRRLSQQKAQRMEKRESLQADILHLQKNIESAGDEIKVLKKQIMVRIRNLYRVNTPTIFQSIFGSQDVMEMDRNAKILYKISKADVDQLRTYRGLKTLLDQQQGALKDKLAEFEKTQKELENKETAIKHNYMAQMDLLKKLDREDQVMLSKIKRIRQKAATLDPDNALNDLTVMFEGGIYDHKGKLEPPVKGVVTKKFGLLELMHDKIKIYHKGWFVSTPASIGVNAVYKGRVVFKGAMDEYKQVLIVDHGDHFYSVYGNLHSSKLSVGQEVETQQVIGEVDQSRFYGNGLYFEIRHFSQSEDPKEWFSDAGINISSLKEQNI
jgi:septal ring factor EnvC (AmiA/AmiB activator)